ncbi:MAG TPA: substrate-binding domain-containing protein, partial [Chitinophagaceae bacterium]|nr:substrate-binding domain-containing protein [Chitinophagaceae bacterium]
MKHPFESCSSLLAKLFVYIIPVLVVRCSNPNAGELETTKSGDIHISVDESFKPVIDSQISVFLSSYPNAKVNAHYKSEADCWRDLFRDSLTRLVIVTRAMSAEEEKFFKDSLNYVPREGILAYDAVAVIVNNKAKDSMFTMNEIREILSGTSSYKLRPVMDGTSATSTVRFAIDSILKGKPLGSNVTAARSSEGVIDYVANNEDAIGFIGVSWIGNPEDTNQVSFLKKVRIASIECVSCTRETFVKPYQGNIAEKRYPMVRSLYYIIRER